MRKRLPAKAYTVQKQLHKGRVGTNPHIDQLSFIKIPIRKKMYHRRFPVIRPRRLPHIIGILRETGGIDLPEIRILRMIGRRLADIVKSRPEELSEGKCRIPVKCHTLFQ